MYTDLRSVLPPRGVTLPPEMAVHAAQLNEIARQEWGNPTWHREQAALIGESVDLGFNNGLTGVFDGVLDTRTIGLTDTVRIKLRHGLEIFSVAEGSYVDESTLETDHFTLGRDTFGWHVVATEQDALADWAETFADLIRLARLKEGMEVVRRQYALLDAAIPSSSPYFVDASGGLTATIMGAAVTDVFDAPRKFTSPLATNSQIQIVGRAAAVDELTGMSGFTQSENSLDEIRALGYLGTFKGAAVRRLSNFVDEDDNSFFPSDELWVISPGAGRFVLYGGTRPNGWVEPALRKVHTDTRRTVGGAVFQPQVVRRIGL